MGEKLYVVLSCWIDLTDPEPNVTIQGIFSTEEKANELKQELIAEGGGSWYGVKTCELDNPHSGIHLGKDDVDMELFY